MEAICDFMNCIKCLSQLGGLLKVTNQNKLAKIFVRTHFLGGWSSIPWLANKYPWAYCSDVVKERIAKGPWLSPCHNACTLTILINNRRWTWLFIHNFLPQTFEERMKHNAPTTQLLTQNHCKMWKTVHTRLRIPFWHSIFKFEMPISIAKCQITCLICCGHNLDWPNLEVKRCK